MNSSENTVSYLTDYNYTGVYVNDCCCVVPTELPKVNTTHTCLHIV